MGLRCLIGHEYGQPQTSEDRRQRGNEVVVTLREYRECRRCGHHRILSENKEVTADAGSEPANDPPAEATWMPDEDETTDEDRSAKSFPVSEADLHDPTDEPLTADEDDGIILEDEPAEPFRGHGEWPEADAGEEPAADATDDHEPWPDEGDEPTPGTEPTATGTPATEPAAEAPSPNDPEPEPAVTNQASPLRPDNRNTEFVCPDCAETWPTQNASLRPGDICPACRRGYLDEQVVQ